MQQDARRTEVRQLARLLHQRIRLVCAAGAVDQPGLELRACGGHGVCGLAQVRDVVEGIVETEDVDAVLRGRGDEAPDEVVVDRTGTDEKSAAKGKPERRLHARLERPDALPRAFDAAPHGALEAAPAGYFEVGEACPIEDLGDLQLLGGREPACQGLLSEQPDGRVRQARHAWSLAPSRRRAGSAVPNRPR